MQVVSKEVGHSDPREERVHGARSRLIRRVHRSVSLYSAYKTEQNPRPTQFNPEDGGVCFPKRQFQHIRNTTWCHNPHTTM